MLIVKDKDTRDFLGIINTASQGAIVRVAEVLFKLVAGVSVGAGGGGRGGTGTPSRRGIEGSRREGRRSSGHCEFAGEYCGGRFGVRRWGIGYRWPIRR